MIILLPTWRGCRIWQQDTDPLVGKAYAICDGKFRLYENHVIAMRKNASDDEILLQFKREVEAAKASRSRGVYGGTSPKSCWWRVYNHFKQRSKDRGLDAKLDRDFAQMEEEFAATKCPKTTVENTGYRQDANTGYRQDSILSTDRKRTLSGASV